MLSRVLPYLLLTLTALFWSGNFVLARAVHDSVPPLTLAAARWGLALLVLTPFAWRHARTAAPLLRPYWPRLLTLGLIGIAGFNSLVYLGLQTTTATNAVLLNSCIPVLILLLCWRWRGDTLRPAQWLGVGLAFAGVLVIVTGGRISQLAHVHLNPGDGLVLVAVVLWALYTVLLRGLPRVHWLGLLWWLILIGSAVVLPCAALEWLAGARIHWQAGTVWTFLYMGIFPSVLAYGFYNRGVAQIGAARAGAFIHLMPVFGTLLAWVLLHEVPQGFQFAGMAAILAGVALGSRTVPSR
jgi:drug/metabolite transporter (DMT)-like permease